MDKDKLINILNNNLNGFNQIDANNIISEYLIEKNINTKNIQLFIQTLCSDIQFMIAGIYEKCLNYCIEYYLQKFEINSIKIEQKQEIKGILIQTNSNKTILYY